MKEYTAQQAIQNFESLIDETNTTHEPILITSEHGNAVLLSEEDWGSIKETLYLMSIPGMKESIVEGMKTPLGECGEELGW